MSELFVRLAAIINTNSLPKPAADSGAVARILTYVFILTAAIAILMIVIGGFRYITAAGDPNGTAQARKTIIFAVVGLFVTLAAYSIVLFVVRNVA